MNQKKIFFIVILFLSFYLTNAQITRDTTVRKKYLDSLKNELAIYTVSSYQYLNWYDRSQEELRKSNERYEIGQKQFNYLQQRKKRENITYGIAIGFLMIMSFTGIIMFSKNN